MEMAYTFGFCRFDYNLMGSLKNKINHLPEVILERDKKQRVPRSRATQMMSDTVAAQKDPGPLGEFHL